MKVVLVTKIKNLGNIGDIVDVKSGFARNFLLPYHKALPATEKYIKDFEEIFSIGMNRAVELLVEAAEKKNNKGGRAGKELKVLGSHPDGEEVKIMSGRYGDYIKWNKINVTIPKEKSVKTLTLEESIALIDEKRKN